jgi:Rrf2 family protein
MFSQTTEYALRAVVFLARNAEQPHTTQQIAQAMRIPSSYLSKVLQALSRHELVRSQRGLHGGFVLSRPTSEITLLDVVNAVDPLKRVCRCPLDLEAHREHLCPLHRRLDDAVARVEDAFSSTYVDELVREAEKADSTPI